MKERGRFQCWNTGSGVVLGRKEASVDRRRDRQCVEVKRIIIDVPVRGVPLSVRKSRIARFIPQEYLQERSAERCVNIFSPPVKNKNAPVVQVTPQESGPLSDRGKSCGNPTVAVHCKVVDVENAPQKQYIDKMVDVPFVHCRLSRQCGKPLRLWISSWTSPLSVPHLQNIYEVVEATGDRA